MAAGGSRMKLKSGIVLALLAILCAGCEPSKPVTVSFLEGQYQVLKPAGWSDLELNDVADLEIGNMFREAYCTVLTEPKSDFADDIDLMRFSEVTREIMVESLKDSKEEGPEQLTLSGQPAVRYVINGTMDSVKVRYWHVSIESEEHFHQVILWSLPSRFDGNVRDFEAVLASIRAAKKKATGGR